MSNSHPSQLRFDTPVPYDGYRWWYIDVVSEDSQSAIVVIAMLGNVFSPNYARLRSTGPANPLDFCTVNVAYYGKHGGLWALTEHASAAVERSSCSLVIGAGQLALQDGCLTVRFHEQTSPFRRTLRGVVRVRSTAWRDDSIGLDPSTHHSWTPLALNARATVELDSPASESWSGRAYVDANAGDEPLERGFRKWDWSRSTGPNATHVVYDVVRKDGSTASFRKTFFPDGPDEPLYGIDTRTLPDTRWGIGRAIPSDAGAQPRVLRSLENTPFYARTLVSTKLHGEPTHLMHETVDLERFTRGWVQYLVPFRMRRAS